MTSWPLVATVVFVAAFPTTMLSVLLAGETRSAAPVPAPPRHPATAYAARPKATPGNRTADAHHRVRADRLDANGTVTLRHAGKLYHIVIGRTYARTHVLLLVQDLHIRVIHAATGELLRELELDPTRSYQPTGKQPGPLPRTPAHPANEQTPNPDCGFGVIPMS
jgi:hypothetical protein